MTHLDFPGASDTSENPGRELPGNVWAPANSSSIQIYWALVDGGYEFAVQLIDAALLEPGDSGIIVWTLVDADRKVVPFSLYDDVSGQLILGGRIEWREATPKPGAAANDTAPVLAPELWLANAHYPDGEKTIPERVA
ncbi:hypothetical protein VDS41_05905 [Xanthomonas campestris pv. campestris]|nr:hypothetical protein [Xanthomonas campestris pv. campestris]